VTFARHDPQLVTAPQPFTCRGGPWSWFDVTIAEAGGLVLSGTRHADGSIAAGCRRGA
jgi:hypothetical protein